MLTENKNVKYEVEKYFKNISINELYKEFRGWKDAANMASKIYIERKDKVSSVSEKLSSEITENSVFNDYARSRKKDETHYKKLAADELIDMGNMAAILLPLDPNNKNDTNYRFDLKTANISCAYHSERYDLKLDIPFDTSKNYTDKKLFEKWIKTLYSFHLQFKNKTPDESTRMLDLWSRLTESFYMIHKDLDDYIKQDYSLLKYIDLRPKWQRMLFDTVGWSMILFLELDDPIEYFRNAKEKMLERKKRYASDIIKRNN